MLRIFPWFFSLACLSLPGQWSSSVISICKAHSDPATPSLVHPSHLCLCCYSSFLISLLGAALSPFSHYPTGGWCSADFHCKTDHSTSPSRIWLRHEFRSALRALDPPISPPCSLCFLFLEYTKIICASGILHLLFPLSGCFSAPLPDVYKADCCFS